MKPTDDELEAMAAKLDRNGPSHADADIWMSGAAAMLRACKGRVRSIGNIDGQVICAARDLGESGKRNPEWAFIDYEENQMSFGRWAKCGENPAPYVRLDLALAALEPAPDHAEWNAAIEAAAKACDDVMAQMVYLNPQARQQDAKFAAAIRALKKGPSHD